MDFRITGLSPESFKPLFVLDDATLAGLGARRIIADDATSFPCRVSLAHADLGEELILLPLNTKVRIHLIARPARYTFAKSRLWHLTR